MTYRIQNWNEYHARHSEDGQNHDLQRMADVVGEAVVVLNPRGEVWATYRPEV